MRCATVLNIIIVYDEPNIRDGMRRSLHGMRAEWAVEYVTRGQEALKSLARVPVDVIVSDMRMPGMDGTSS